MLQATSSSPSPACHATHLQPVQPKVVEPQNETNEAGGHRQEREGAYEWCHQRAARGPQRVQRVGAGGSPRLQQQLLAAAAQHRGVPGKEHEERHGAAQNDGLPVGKGVPQWAGQGDHWV